jgi:hypothetical protein
MESIFKFLIDYPLEVTPYPDGYPEDLIFDDYPGQDYVVGFCDEAIEECIRTSADAKSKQGRDLLLGYAELFQTLRAHRFRLLSRV